MQQTQHYFPADLILLQLLINLIELTITDIHKIFNIIFNLQIIY